MKKCNVSRYCGGCSYQGLTYEKQLEIKQESMEKLLSSFHHVEKIIPCKTPYHYRNKVQMSFGYDENHKIICGYYLPDSHQILPVDSCQIADEGMNDIFSSILKIVIRTKTSVYDERSKKGFLRHVLIRSNHNNEYMVVLVTTSFHQKKAQILSQQINKYNPNVVSIIMNINRKPTSMVLGNENITLYGKGEIEDRLCGLKFRISPSSFYQTNRYQTQVLYEEAIRIADFNGNEILIDAYCGTGTIGLAAARYVGKVYGVESNRSALRDAFANKKINGIENIDFFCEDAGKYMERLAEKKTHIDAVIMDPPRAGSDLRFMSSMVRMKPDKIIYVSCNPVTLKRDLSYLRRYYEIQRIQPVDMFPFTKHVETVCLMSRVEGK